MAWLGANDEDEAGDVALIRAPKAAAQNANTKPRLVPTGPPIITRYALRLSDYRKPASTDGSTAESRQLCLVIDNAELGTVDTANKLQLTVKEGGTGLLSVFREANDSSPIPFSTTAMVSSRDVNVLGNAAPSSLENTASSAAESLLYVVENGTSHHQVTSPTPSTVVLTPLQKVWRARRMVEMETRNTNPGSGLSGAWSMAVDVMERRDKAVSGEIRHVDDAIEEAPANQPDALAMYEQRTKKLRVELEDVKAMTASRKSTQGQKVPLSNQSIASSTTPNQQTTFPHQAVLRQPPTPHPAPLVVIDQPSNLEMSTSAIVIRLIKEERINGVSQLSASQFVSRVLKALPEFAEIAASKDKRREAQWVKESKANVIATIKDFGCEIVDGNMIFPK